MTTTRDDHGRQQAEAQLSSIKGMVAALENDWERLEDLRDELETLTDAVNSADDESDKAQAEADLAAWRAENQEELDELTAAAGDYENEEQAREAIQEDPLEIAVRSGWASPGETANPEEYKILLCTGGPAVMITGDLDDHNQPETARLMFQDWFTPWEEYITTGEDNDALLTYAQQFYFGD